MKVGYSFMGEVGLERCLLNGLSSGVYNTAFVTWKYLDLPLDYYIRWAATRVALVSEMPW